MLIFHPSVPRVKEVWDQPSTLFVLGRENNSVADLDRLQRAAHVQFGSVVVLSLPIPYGQLKTTVQHRVHPFEQTYLFIDWSGVRKQALGCPHRDLDPQQAQRLSELRAMQWPEAGISTALFLAEKTGRIPVLLSTQDDLDGSQEITARFPDAV